MNILVTGGSGFIGSHIVDKLVESGHRVTVFDLKPPHRLDVPFLKGAITSKDDIKEAMKNNIEIVYHIAAFSNIDLVRDNPLATIESNIMGTAYLLDECKSRGINRFIFASSVYIYSNQGHLYTTCKLASELLCKNYNTLYSIPYTILRYGTAYGPRSRGADVISLFVKQALKGEKLTIRGSGNQKRYFIYVEDIALGNLASLKEAAQNKTYTLANKQPVNINKLAQIINSIFDGRLSIEHAPNREDDYQGKILDFNKAESELGWKPTVSLEEGIKKYISWCRKNCP